MARRNDFTLRNYTGEESETTAVGFRGGRLGFLLSVGSIYVNRFG